MKQTSRLCMLTVVNDVSACGATYFIMSALWCMINKVCKTADITTKYIQSFRCYYFENSNTWKKRVWKKKYVLRFSQRNYSQVLFLLFCWQQDSTNYMQVYIYIHGNLSRCLCTNNQLLCNKNKRPLLFSRFDVN